MVLASQFEPSLNNPRIESMAHLLADAKLALGWA